MGKGERYAKDMEGRHLWEKGKNAAKKDNGEEMRNNKLRDVGEHCIGV